MNPAASALPRVSFRDVGKHGRVSNVRKLAAPLAHLGIFIEIRRRLCTPIKVNRPSMAALHEMPNHRSERRIAGTAADEYRRARGFFAKPELAEGAFDSKQRLLGGTGEKLLRELAGRDSPHVQLDEICVVGWIGDGET